MKEKLILTIGDTKVYATLFSRTVKYSLDDYEVITIYDIEIRTQKRDDDSNHLVGLEDINIDLWNDDNKLRAIVCIIGGF